MPITAVYSPALRKLSVFGDAAAQTIIISRNFAGQLFVNGGAVPVSGGTPTISNTDLIEAFGSDGNDVLTIDESSGPLPAVNLSGGIGNDSLTAGSQNDVLNGDAGVDSLLGGGGSDQLFGGTDADTLSGGDGNDQLSGGDGDDRMIWNPGDDDDVMEGGTGTNDVAEINGDNAAETFAITPSAGRISFTRTAPVSFGLDIGTTESLVLNANGGNDTIDASTLPSGLISLILDGGAGDDTIFGSAGADLLLGGADNDIIDGNQGLDTAFLGAGNDVFKWDPGDASDVIEGQADADELLFNGSNASEIINIFANGGRVVLQRDVAAILMDLNDVEKITYNAIGGADNVVVGDMSGTDLTSVVVDLAATGGLGDGQVDSVTVNGTNGNDVVTATQVAGLLVSGLAAQVLVETQEGTDRLVLALGGGDDVVDASGIGAAQVKLELLGGLGADIFIGSAGADLIVGGDGSDTALMGAGNDEFLWVPGDDNDTLEGQAGTDKMTFNGANVAENINISANGGRILFFRDIANVTMDLNDVEQITFNALGGADTITINDLTGTDATLVTVNLAGTLGGTVGDTLLDVITANGESGADAVTIAGTGGAITVVGLPSDLAINQSEAADRLVINTGVGADSVSASGLAAGNTALTINGGAGNDNIAGSSGADVLLGGFDNDTIAGGAGDDQMFGEDGNDRMIWNPGDGTDLMEGGAGTGDVAEVNGGSGAETFTITANGVRVRFDRVDPAPFALDIGTTESLVLNAGGGNDIISTAGNLATLIALVIDGGAGDDNILGGNGADLLLGGEGNDFIDGQQGNDIAFLGAGNDLFQWDPGDGSDTVEGQAGGDNLLFNGSGGNENFALSASGGRVRLTRDIANIVMDLDDVETLAINALGGGDTIVVNDLTGTDATGVTVNLAGTIGGAVGDALTDNVTASGTGLADTIVLSGAGGAYTVIGIPATLSVNQSEAIDRLTIHAGGGNDIVSAASLAAGVTLLILNGDVGDDVLVGSAGADTLQGGTGNDTYGVNSVADVITEFAGQGDDTISASASYTLAAGVSVEAMSTSNQAGIGAINLTGNEIANSIFGNEGNNLLLGLGGNDQLTGFGGNDVLVGGGGIDFLRGGLGNDVYGIGEGDVILETADEGDDSLAADIGSYFLNDGASIETLSTANQAGTFAQNLTGNELGQSVAGSEGANVLNGRLGNDLLRGYGGADIFLFDTAAGANNHDVIADMQAGIDKIALQNSVFTGLAEGNLGANAFRTGSAAQDADDRIIWNAATNQLFYDADGNGAGAAVLFAIVNGSPNLQASDFIIV